MDIIDTYYEVLRMHPEYATPVAVIKSLIMKISLSSKENTMAEFTIALEALTFKLVNELKNASVRAGCELFSRFVARMISEDTGTSLVQRANSFVENSLSHRVKISAHGVQFISDNSKILIHSFSRVVMHLLEDAAKDRRFFVYITESRPGNFGMDAYSFLQAKNIPCQVILDSAVGFFMNKIDLVLVGAEAVVENGGIVNQIGTFQIAVLAQSAHKPFYALAESYKFVRLFPLGQEDLPSHLSSSTVLIARSKSDLTLSRQKFDHPLVDYTPPSYITLLFTDLGVLTPSGVSDELIKFYY